jgi:hypothetical protein
MSASDDTGWITAGLTAVLNATDARASGLWRVQGDRLILLGFAAAASLESRVARDFAEATRTVPLDRTGLGIVRAWNEGRPVVTWAHEQPADAGSGRWLRAFNAERSVAVPIGREAVLSIALNGGQLNDNALVARLQREGSRWLHLLRDSS